MIKEPRLSAWYLSVAKVIKQFGVYGGGGLGMGPTEGFFSWRGDGVKVSGEWLMYISFQDNCQSLWMAGRAGEKIKTAKYTGEAETNTPRFYCRLWYYSFLKSHHNMDPELDHPSDFLSKPCLRCTFFGLMRSTSWSTEKVQVQTFFYSQLALFQGPSGHSSPDLLSSCTGHQKLNL